MSQLENAQVEAALGCFEGSYNELTSASCMVVVTSQRLLAVLAVLARYVYHYPRGNRKIFRYRKIFRFSIMCI